MNDSKTKLKIEINQNQIDQIKNSIDKSNTLKNQEKSIMNTYFDEASSA